MYRIGVINLDVSHPKAFSTYLNKGTRARYTAVYNDGFRADDEVEAFMRANNIETRDTDLMEMARKVDVAFIQGCNWEKHLAYAQIFLKMGKPVFIDKPIVGNLRDCHLIEQLAAEGGVIYGSSSLRYATEVASYAAIPEEERGRMVHITTTVGVDAFNYAIHAVETIMGLLGTDARAESTAYIGSCGGEDSRCESYQVHFFNGVTAMYHVYLNSWQPSTMTVVTTKSTHCTVIDAGVAYGVMLDHICDALDGKETPLAPVESLTESIKIMLAGRRSREKNGEPIFLASLSEEDAGFDGDAFEKDYAATAKKIYLA